MKKIIFILLIIPVLLNAQTGWQVLNSGITSSLNGIWFTDFQTGYACGGSGTIIKTTNSGVNWTSLNSSVTYTLNDICFADNSTGYCAGNSGIIKTTNAGANWFSVYNVQSYSMACIQNVIYSGGQAGLYKSTDSGQNWSLIRPSTPYQIYGIYFNNKDTGQIMGSIGYQFKTTNGGTNWKVGAYWGPDTVNFSKCYFYDSGSGFVCFTHNHGFPTYNKSYGIFKCNYWTNTGSSWYNVYYNNNRPVSGITMTGNDTGYAAGGGYVSPSYQSLILKSTDGGNNWSEYNYNFGEALYDIFFHNSKTGYACGRNGIIIKTTDGGITAAEPIASEVPSSFYLGQNYPNPFNPSTKIRFDLPKSGFTELRVFDITGREVQTLVNENLSAGSYEVTFDGSGLAGGVYFYRITAGDYSETRKMLLIK